MVFSKSKGVYEFFDLITDEYGTQHEIGGEITFNIQKQTFTVNIKKIPGIVFLSPRFKDEFAVLIDEARSLANNIISEIFDEADTPALFDREGNPTFYANEPEPENIKALPSPKQKERSK